MISTGYIERVRTGNSVANTINTRVSNLDLYMQLKENAWKMKKKKKINKNWLWNKSGGVKYQEKVEWIVPWLWYCMTKESRKFVDIDFSDETGDDKLGWTLSGVMSEVCGSWEFRWRSTWRLDLKLIRQQWALGKRDHYSDFGTRSGSLRFFKPLSLT